MPETLYIIDTYAQVFRAYFAIRGGMRSPVTSEPTHAVFGFTGMLTKLFRQFKPHYVIAAYDAPGKTFRDDMYAEYKATRNVTPDDLTAQIPRIFELIELFGIPLIGSPGYEADDVVATIVHRILNDPETQDVDIRLVSKDKDLEQLLGPRVSMFDIHTDTTIDVAALMTNKGIRPEQVVDYLALIGDNVDNVKGVDGIGPKTASELIQQFGSIDGIYANLDKIKGKRRENLEAAVGHLPLSRKLVELCKDCPVEFSMDEARLSPPKVPELVGLFQQLGFNRFQDEVRSLVAAGALPTAELPTPPEFTGALDFESTPSHAIVTKEVGTVKDGDYRAVTNEADLAQLVATLKSQTLISVDTETTGLGKDSQLCGFSFAWTEGAAVYVPVLSPEQSEHLDESTVVSALKPLLEDPALGKCGHNVKFDAAVLLRHGVRLRGVVFDSMLAMALIDAGLGNAKLDNLAQKLLNYQMVPITDLIGDGKDQVSMEEVPLCDITPYAAEDADIALRLMRALEPKLREMGLDRLLREVEAPLTTVLAEMEFNGILCDPDELQRQGDDLGARADELKRAIFEAAGMEFDLNSTKQLAEVLFDRIGFKVVKKTKTGRSTDAEVLDKLVLDEDKTRPETAVPRLILEYRQLSKLISTYLGNLRAAINANTGRIHTTYHQLVTATGRLASQNPNLQNIPVRTDVGRQIRKAFPAPGGKRLICADYSQIELRILAHLSNDPALISAFESEEDIHTAVAAEVFHTPLDQVTREQRSNAKTINFGIIYGVTPYGLSRRIDGMDVPTATVLIADYKARFRGIDTFLNECIQKAMQDGYVNTMMGRRRAIPEVHSGNMSQRALGERLAINSVVQGSAADLIKVAMVNMARMIDADKLPLKMLLQIHDELVFEAPVDQANELAKIICEEMERAMHLKVPLRAECGVGDDWYSAK
jgi:DNA polymerase-1